MSKKRQSEKKAGTKAAKKTKVKKSASSPARGRDSETVIVKGPESIHMFDLGIVTDFAKATVFRNYQIRQADIEFCRSIQKLLVEKKPSKSWITEFSNQKLYRVCSPHRNPLDTAGTFGAGGRCNFGMAQRCEEFPGLIATYGLYASMDARTAAIEAASGISVSTEITFEVAKKDGSPCRLIDYDSVVGFFDGFHSGLVRIVAESPYNAEWSLQKNPKPSQVMGDWLRSTLKEKADGLFFSSTKNPTGKNVLIFANSSNSLEVSYTATEV